jgi:hypothetical protein
MAATATSLGTDSGTDEGADGVLLVSDEDPMTTTVLSQLRSSAVTASLEALDLPEGATIVDVTPFDIARMPDGELLRMIRSARLPLMSDVDERLEYRDRPTLVRLAHLARRCGHSRKAALPMDRPVDGGGA